MFLEPFENREKIKNKTKPAQVSSTLPDAAHCLMVLILPLLAHLVIEILKATFSLGRYPLERLCSCHGA